MLHCYKEYLPLPPQIEVGTLTAIVHLPILIEQATSVQLNLDCHSEDGDIPYLHQ